MTNTFRRIGLGLGGAMIAWGLVAGVYVSAQNPQGPDGPPPFRGGRGGRMMGPPPMGPGFGIPGPLPMIASQLGLTDAQKDQMKAAAESHRDEWKAIGDRMGAARKALATAVTSGQFDEATIRSRAADIGVIEADAAVAGARAYAEFRQLLTPAQQEKLKTLSAQMQERRGPPRGRRPGPPPQQ